LEDIIIIGTIIISFYFLYILIISLLSPYKITELYKRAKEKDTQIFPFMPKKLLDFIFFNNSSKLTIWFTRIMAIIGLCLSSFIIYAFLFYMK
jgi:hypothetical protein